MTGTLIDARTQFLMKALIDQLDNLIKDNKDWHSYCLLVEEDGEDYQELFLLFHTFIYLLGNHISPRISSSE